MNGGWGISNEIALRWMPLDLTDDKSALVQVMAWCRQATSHYLSQCWPRSMASNGVTRPQWVNAYSMRIARIEIDQIWRRISQFPLCTTQISHNTPFCNRNVHTCAHLGHGIWDWCIVGFVWQVYQEIDQILNSRKTLHESCLLWVF